MITFLKKLFGFPDTASHDKHRIEVENTDDGRMEDRDEDDHEEEKDTDEGGYYGGESSGGEGY